VLCWGNLLETNLSAWLPTMADTRSDKAEQILAGGMQVFLEHGYAGTSMDRIAATACVSKATLYNHFRDKEALFAALVQKMAQRKIPDLLAHDLPDQPPQLVLRQLAERFLDASVNDPEHIAFVRLVIGESGRFPALAQLFLDQMARTVLDRLSRYLASRSELKLADPEAAARVFLGSLAWFVMTQEMLAGKAILPMDPDRLINTLIVAIAPPAIFHETLITNAGTNAGTNSGSQAQGNLD
jgi:TetR/AcrR family transcriptional regulator